MHVDESRYETPNTCVCIHIRIHPHHIYSHTYFINSWQDLNYCVRLEEDVVVIYLCLYYISISITYVSPTTECSVDAVVLELIS